MNDVYEHYYSAYFAEKGHALTREQAEIHANRYEWNFSSWLRRVPRGARVLDLGCGTGEFLYYLRKEGFQRMIGVDISSEQLHEAQRFFATLAGEGTQPMWEQSGVLQFLKNQPEGRFGMIVMNDLLEHVGPDEALELLQAARRVLGAETPLLLKLPNMDNPFAASLRWRDLTHRAGYTESSLRHLLIAAGFDRVQIVGESAPRRTIKQKIRHQLLYRGATALMRLGYYAFEMSPAPSILSKNLLVRAFTPAKTASAAETGKAGVKGTDKTMGLEELDEPQPASPKPAPQQIAKEVKRKPEAAPEKPQEKAHEKALEPAPEPAPPKAEEKKAEPAPAPELNSDPTPTVEAPAVATVASDSVQPAETDPNPPAGFTVGSATESPIESMEPIKPAQDDDAKSITLDEEYQGIDKKDHDLIITEQAEQPDPEKRLPFGP